MEGKKEVALALSPVGVALVGVFVGLLLAVIGLAIGNSEVASAGAFILPFALFAGGFLLKDENPLVRAGMFIAAGLILAQAAALGGSLSKALGGW